MAKKQRDLGKALQECELALDGYRYDIINCLVLSMPRWQAKKYFDAFMALIARAASIRREMGEEGQNG